jgi:hypothetical protein
MFDDLCFADRTNDSRIQETMIISVYKQSYKDIKKSKFHITAQISFPCTSKPVVMNNKMKKSSSDFLSQVIK